MLFEKEFIAIQIQLTETEEKCKKDFHNNGFRCFMNNFKHLIYIYCKFNILCSLRNKKKYK